MRYLKSIFKHFVCWLRGGHRCMFVGLSVYGGVYFYRCPHCGKRWAVRFNEFENFKSMQIVSARRR